MTSQSFVLSTPRRLEPDLNSVPSMVYLSSMIRIRSALGALTLLQANSEARGLR